MIAGVTVLAAAFSVAEANPVPVPVHVDLGVHAPVAVIPEPLKLRLGGFAKKGLAEDNKGRRKYKAPPIPGLPKAS